MAEFDLTDADLRDLRIGLDLPAATADEILARLRCLAVAGYAVVRRADLASNVADATRMGARYLLTELLELAKVLESAPDDLIVTGAGRAAIEALALPTTSSQALADAFDL